MDLLSLKGIYCNDLTRYSRLVTREVKVGDIPMGGSNPIRIQSMTTTDTMDTKATVEQAIRMIDAGCEYVRITAPSINEAKNLLNIRNELHKRGYKNPLVADIHFTPNAAEAAARIVEKVRVNPGNFADKKKFEVINYDDNSYDAELQRIRERFIPLVKICKEYGTAMRIGTNHGSLSDRIMSRYGDSPLGMVESALEFLRIAGDENYHNIVLSMKSSNPQVMVQAYRLLIVRMAAEGMNYPLHLGVTEAGEGEDGRIKSAAGIGTLLEDGIGDTIRVSLTEDPEFEIPVAKALVARYNNRASHRPLAELPSGLNSVTDPTGNTYQYKGQKIPYSPFLHERRTAATVSNTGYHTVPVVVSDLSATELLTPASLFGVGYKYSVTLDKWNISDQACDYIYTGRNAVTFALPGTLGVIIDAGAWQSRYERHYPFYKNPAHYHTLKHNADFSFVSISEDDVFNDIALLKSLPALTVLVMHTDNLHAMPALRRMFIALIENGITNPVIIQRDYNEESTDQVQLYAATDAGALFLDGFGDGIMLSANGHASPQMLNSLAFGILQAARTRISKTEYISCPSCGRTLFDLQETTARIRQRTSHLKGIKIGIMGCIVNGPGEMADADYGYVGSGPGKITLYKGREVVQRNVDASAAVDALISLIRDNGDWIEQEIIQSESTEA